MRTALVALTSILAAISLSGCLTLTEFSAKSSGQMRCAQMGQAYSGFNITGVRDGYDVGEIKCKLPETEKEKCEVTQCQSTIEQGQALNEQWYWKRIAVKAGYLYYLPGRLMYEYWHDENATDYSSLYSDHQTRLQTCEKPDVAH